MNAKTRQRRVEQHGAEASASVDSTKTSQAAVSKVSAERCVSFFLSVSYSEDLL